MRRALRATATATLLLTTAATTAYAFVRSRTEKGVAVHWSGGCAFIQPDLSGSPDLPADQLFAIVQKSIANWQDAVGGGAYLKLMYQAPATLEAHLDGINTVKFRSDRWCHPNDAQQNNVCYSASAAGITTVFFVQDGSDKAGTILDADIELNDINFTFAVLPTTAMPRAGTQLADLENTLTHELGHLQGLDHTCKDSATPAQEVDEFGNTPPDCDKLFLLPIADQQRLKNATMYNFAQPNETGKRSPEADDVAGIVDAYPPASDPGTCAQVNIDDYKTHGCSISGRAPRSLAGIAVLLGALVALVARRRRS
ncbi:MAG: peptidase and matrixin and adamalysin [Myxococcales bacterium]|nr:peptidase and matrixin and adamalysin [Myxococcales bacterium]